MSIIEYIIVPEPTPANLAAAITSKATGLAAQGRAAFPVANLKDSSLFGEAEPGNAAIAIVQDEVPNLLGLLDYALANSAPEVNAAIAAQIHALEA
jgi:hypothetical protein